VAARPPARGVDECVRDGDEEEEERAVGRHVPSSGEGGGDEKEPGVAADDDDDGPSTVDTSPDIVDRAYRGLLTTATGRTPLASGGR
jgi:hypothetical protein